MTQKDPKQTRQEKVLSVKFRQAAERGQLSWAQSLLAEGVEKETLQCALYSAAQNGHTDFVRWLVEDIGIDMSRRGPAALLAAIRARHTGIVDCLTADGRLPVSPGSLLQHGCLRAAIDPSEAPYDPAILQLLIDRGARPIADGLEVVDRAVALGNRDALARLAAAEPAVALSLQKRLNRACVQLDPDAIATLLAVGADPSPGGIHPLRIVLNRAGANPVYRHQQNAGNDIPPERFYWCVRHLVDAGADPSLWGQESLKLAVSLKNRDLIGYLLDKGLDIEPEFRGIGYNRLVLAALYNFPSLVGRFHDAGGIEDAYYHEALHAAAENGHRDLVYQLLSYGFDATCTDHFDIALAAALGGHLDLLKEFMAKGYKTDLCDDGLVEFAIGDDHGDILDFLFDHGADEGKAILAYSKLSSSKRAPLASAHGTLRAWGERRTTTLYPLDFDGNIRHLRIEAPDHTGHMTSNLIRMAKAGRFQEVIDAAVSSGDNGNDLTIGDFSREDRHGNTLVEILGARGELGRLLDNEPLWKGRLDDLRAVVALVPPVYRSQFDHQRCLARLHRQTLLEKRANFPKIGK